MHANEEIRVYSDGSAVDRGVGGAAVAMEGERILRERRFHLGNDKTHTVYEGEVVGMILAVQLIKEELEARGERELTMALGVDNQAAIRTTTAFQSKPGHYLVDKFHDDLRKTLSQTDSNSKLTIRWSAGHIGIAGNEAADEQAKRAARGDTSSAGTLPQSLLIRNCKPTVLPISKSTIKQEFNRTLKDEAVEVLRQSPQYPYLRTIDSSAPSKHFADLVSELPRRHSSLLFQLRTGHVPLNKHLHRISKSTTFTCPACR